jgi:hypothetical protein
MELIENWFQDWRDACEYAKECAPDVSLAVPHEPYSALASIAVARLILWGWNERKIGHSRKSERRLLREADFLQSQSNELHSMLDRLRSALSTPTKKAA